jgi:hypothetical protein
MCPAMTSPPFPLASVFTGAALRGWFILGVSLILCAFIILFRTRFGEDDGRSIALSCILVLSLGICAFLTLGIADTWGRNLAAWYGGNIDALAAQNCPINVVRTRYTRLSSEQQKLEALGYLIFVGAFVIVFVADKWDMWMARKMPG